MDLPVQSKNEFMNSSFLKGLNTEQKIAAQHNEGPLLILAGAGSGKTTVLVSRTGRLIEENRAKPENILVLTFTNKAAKELKKRVLNQLGTMAKGLWASTFHSFGLQLLRMNYKEAQLPSQFSVIDNSDSVAILRELIKETKIVGKDKFDLDRILEIINSRRVLGRWKLEGQDEYHEVAEILFPKYIKKMEVFGVVDFEGLLLKPLELFKAKPNILQQIQNKYQQVMVDEFQDINDVQMKLVDSIVQNHRNITVVGDDDQSIYGWRGAQISNILNFPQRYKPCKVVRLEKNYRSSPEILAVANEVIKKNSHRHGKILQSQTQSQKPLGEILDNKNSVFVPEIFLVDHDEEEAQLVLNEIKSWKNNHRISYSEMAVLYRVNAQSGLIEALLREENIPYKVSGSTSFFDRKEVKDVLAYLRFSISPNDVSFKRIINIPARGIGDSTIEKVNQYSIKCNTPFWKACKSWKEMGIHEKIGHSLEHLIMFLNTLAPELIRSQQSAGEKLLLLLKEIGYRDYLFNLSTDPTTGEKRWTLIEILSRILNSFIEKGGPSLKTLMEFIDALELRDDSEDPDQKPEASDSPSGNQKADGNQKIEGKVNLMTLHASKGLEFQAVIMVGIEEDLLPHKTLGQDLAEERRLFYVGLTRAKKYLLLSHCRERQKRGRRISCTPSRFLLDIPKNLSRIYNNGSRPLSSKSRDQLVSSFLAQLEKSGPNGQPSKSLPSNGQPSKGQ